MSNGHKQPPNPVDVLLGLARIEAAAHALKGLALRAYAMGHGASLDAILAPFNTASTALAEISKGGDFPAPPNCPSGTVPVDGMCM